MSFRKLVFLTSTFLFLCSLAIGQTEPAATPDAEKEKKQKEIDEKVVQMLHQAIGDAPTLRLPQNRAIVYAMAGDLYWKYDEKRSRDLFRSAANEILALNAESEKEKRESADAFFEFPDFNDTRSQVLPLVAKNDADLALELLIQTRSSALAEAILKASAPDAKAEGGMFSYNPDKLRVSQEIALEQRFALLAADENPDKAIKLIKESLAKGVSYSVLQLLQKLNKKDEKKATELASEVIRKLIDTDLAKKSDEMQVAIGFLQFATRTDAAPNPNAKEKPFKFTEIQAKDLATKLANTFLQPANSVELAMALTRSMSSLEKLVPEKIPLLKQRQADGQKTLPTEFKNMQRQQKLWDSNSTPEDILAEIPKLQNEMEKNMAYQSLTSKIDQIEDETRAKRLIDQIPDEKARERALNQFESSKISRAASAGKLDDARKMIGNLTSKKTQVQKLVSLAIQFNKKGTEKDAETAESLMKNAKSLINESPEDEDELNDLMEVVKGYAIVEPDTAFRMFEPIVDQINDFVMASAILSKYNKRTRTFKKGELIMRSNGNSFDGVLLFRYINQMQLLGKADLDRMSLLSDRFQRSDSRTIVKLFVVQGFLKDDKKSDSSVMGGESFYFEY